MTYPSFQINENFIMNDLSSLNPLNSPITMFVSKTEQKSSPLLVNIYHHLFETLNNVLSSASSQFLHDIFNEIILPNIFLSETPIDLKIFLFAIAEKIISISQGDLPLSINFIINTLLYLQSPQNSIKSAAQRLWLVLKNKGISHLVGRGGEGAMHSKFGGGLRVDSGVLGEGGKDPEGGEWLTGGCGGGMGGGRLMEWLGESIKSTLREEGGGGKELAYLELSEAIVERERRASENYFCFGFSNNLMNLSNPYLGVLLPSLSLWLDFALKTLLPIDLFLRIWTLYMEICELGESKGGVQEVRMCLLGKIGRICRESFSLNVIHLKYTIVLINSLEVIFIEKY